MTTKKVITLSTVKQLIDLNGSSTNFDLTFTARSLDNSEFYALVVDQRTLDSDIPLQFKLAKGSISANIVTDKNVYQNHFLCLKSDKPTQVEVIIDKKEILPQLLPQPQHPYSQSNAQRQTPSLRSPISQPKTNWTLIITVLALGATGAFAYYYFFYNKKNTKESTIITSQPMSIPEPIPTPMPIPIQKSILPETPPKPTLSARLSSLLNPHN